MFWLIPVGIAAGVGVLLTTQSGCGDANASEGDLQKLRSLQDQYLEQCNNVEVNDPHGDTCSLDFPTTIADANAALQRRACFFDCKVTVTFRENGQVVREDECHQSVETNLAGDVQFASEQVCMTK